MATTLCDVLKPFGYAADGIHGERLEAGRKDVPINIGDVAGLEREGFVRRAGSRKGKVVRDSGEQADAFANATPEPVMLSGEGES